MNLTAQVRAAKTSVKVARALVRIILRDGLTPGDRLPPERDMTAQFGVARGTLREALRLLEAQDLITLKAGPGGGPIVTRPNADSLAEYMSNVLSFYDTTLEDFIVARQHLAPMVAYTAAEQRTPEDIDDLHALLREERERIGASSSRGSVRDFYIAVAEAAHNPIFLILSASLSGVNDASVTPLIQARIGEFLEYTHAPEAHERIIDAISGGDPEQARACMLKHTTNIANFLRQAYPERLATPLWQMIASGMGEPDLALKPVGARS